MIIVIKNIPGTTISMVTGFDFNIVIVDYKL